MNIPSKDPLFRIISACLIIIFIFILSITIIALINENNPYGSLFLIFLIPLAIIVGPYMGIVYPDFSYIYPFGLLFFFFLSVVGFKYRQNNYGQLISVIGICGWIFLGLVGLGTGT